MKTTLNKIHGFTLLELLISLAMFGIVSAMMYSTFNLVTKQVGSISTQNALSDKGQRILAFMEEDIRMIAYLLGPEASIPYCAGANDGLGGTLPATSPVLTYSSGSPFDSLSFITSVPITLKETAECKVLFIPGSGAQKDCSTGDRASSANGDRIDYFLTSQCESTAGGKTVYVDAIADCFGDILMGDNLTQNGRSLVTFDSLLLSASGVAGSAPQVYYSLSAAPDSTKTFTFSEELQQNIPDGSTVYTVRMYRYLVDNSVDDASGHTGSKRNLKRVGWDRMCIAGSGVTVDLVETSNATNTSGGVDGLKFEFISINTLTGQLVTTSSPPASLNELKAIKIWLLLRSDKIDPEYTNKEIYTLGSTTLAAFNDHYRRQLLNKTVEVKNLARIY